MPSAPNIAADEVRPDKDKLGLPAAASLNVANMIGIGPFITIPAFLAAMGGPQALIGWVIAAVLVLCDGLVWSELGAALPGSGGSYHFFREIFGRYRWGRIVPFLFIWQFLVSGTLELASGYIGAVQYLLYVFPELVADPLDQNAGIPLALKWAAASTALLVSLVLCLNIRTLGRLSVVLASGSLLTVLIVIVAGALNFNPALLKAPPGAWKFDLNSLPGLGAAMLIAIYDYLGYYNVCHLGAEVRDPGRTIPRAVIISVLLVAALYLTMNLCIIGVLPWQEAMHSKAIAADFMERLYGRPVAVAFTALILWTVVACTFVMTLGYSRIPMAAAQRGDFFPFFARLLPRFGSPWASLLFLGGLTAIFCFFPLMSVINAAVSIRILSQFVMQIVGLAMLRLTRPDVSLPFRMWLYPLPSLVALVGWLFVLFSSSFDVLQTTAWVLGGGLAAYAIWQGVLSLRKKSAP